MNSDLTDDKGLFWFDKEVWRENVQMLVDLGELEEGDLPDPDEFTTYEILEEVYKDGKDAVYKI